MTSIALYIFLIFWPQIILSFMAYNDVKISRFVLFIAFCPIAIFASIRGYAGTDTAAYRDLFDYAESYAITIDPLFWYPQTLIRDIGLDFQAYTFLHSVVVLYLYITGVSKLAPNNMYLSVSILPVLMLDSTFNGLRYGLSFALVCYVVAMFNKRSNYLTRVWLLVPSLAHISMLPLIFLKIHFTLLGLIAVFCISFIVFQFLPIQYLIYKFEIYQELSRPEGYSGIMPVIQFLVFYFINYKFCLNSDLSNSLKIMGLVIFLISLPILIYSYAGLRFLQISVLLIGLSTAASEEIRRPKFVLLLSTSLGILTNFNFLRQIIFSNSDAVNFLPYDFFFQINFN
jgi:EpsG family